MQYKIFQELSNIIHATVNSFIIFLSAELLHLEAVFQLLKKKIHCFLTSLKKVLEFDWSKYLPVMDIAKTSQFSGNLPTFLQYA